MPRLEAELRRYGAVLDRSAASTGQAVELVTAPRSRRVTRTVRTVFAAFAVVVVAIVIAVAMSTRSTKEPSPATSPTVTPSTASPTTASGSTSHQFPSVSLPAEFLFNQISRRPGSRRRSRREHYGEVTNLRLRLREPPNPAVGADANNEL